MKKEKTHNFNRGLGPEVTQNLLIIALHIPMQKLSSLGAVPVMIQRAPFVQNL